jgi:hypothetical protein
VADLEFFLDPVCPWAWITSRWVAEVARLRDYDVAWRFISLKMVNEERGYGDTPERYRQLHDVGLGALRTLAAARASGGNDAVARGYTAIGTEAHVRGRGDEAVANRHAFLADALSRHGLDPSWADAHDDTSLDALVGAETFAALERTGRGVGTPILTFAPGTPREASLFGPVVSRAPKGDDALRLWDAVETIAGSGVAELKRALREAPVFEEPES